MTTWPVLNVKQTVEIGRWFIFSCSALSNFSGGGRDLSNLRLILNALKRTDCSKSTLSKAQRSYVQKQRLTDQNKGDHNGYRTKYDKNWSWPDLYEKAVHVNSVEQTSKRNLKTVVSYFVEALLSWHFWRFVNKIQPSSSLFTDAQAIDVVRIRLASPYKFVHTYHLNTCSTAVGNAWKHCAKNTTDAWVVLAWVCLLAKAQNKYQQSSHLRDTYLEHMLWPLFLRSEKLHRTESMIDFGLPNWHIWEGA